ncbi:MAG TPA: hypothetical protein VG897_18405 [Terriglobales bacterium]|nr:hypothetical protein [Terriglobales bacterium]
MALVVPAALNAQIALVQATSCGPQTFPTSTCSITATGAGHLIVVGIQIGGGATTSTTIATVTDNAGNAYSEANSATSVLSGGTPSRSVDTSGGSIADIWYVRSSVAGATSLTITPSTTVSNAGAVIWEFSGVNTSAPLDQVGVLNSQAASASPTGASVTTALSNEVVISLAAVSGSISGIFAGNAFTSDSALKSNGWAHLITTSARTFTPQWNQSPAGTFASSTVSFKGANATPAFSACDLNQDGVANVADVQLGTNMNLSQSGQLQSGQTGYRTCTANILGPGVCTSTADSASDAVIVDQLRTAALGGACTTANSHSVLLNWGASSTSGVSYNVYRSTSSSVFSTTATPSTTYKITSIPVGGLSYIDGTVFAGQTYYYAITAVNSSGESYASNTATAAVPFP